MAVALCVHTKGDEPISHRKYAYYPNPKLCIGTLGEVRILDRGKPAQRQVPLPPFVLLLVTESSLLSSWPSSSSSLSRRGFVVIILYGRTVSSYFSCSKRKRDTRTFAKVTLKPLFPVTQPHYSSPAVGRIVTCRRREMREFSP